jgi:hypothetical protein
MPLFEHICAECGLVDEHAREPPSACAAPHGGAEPSKPGAAPGTLSCGLRPSLIRRHLSLTMGAVSAVSQPRKQENMTASR